MKKNLFLLIFAVLCLRLDFINGENNQQNLLSNNSFGSVSKLSSSGNSISVQSQQQLQQQQQQEIKVPSFLSENYIINVQKFLRNLKNQRCSRDLNSTLNGIIEGSPWAVAMYDSSVKVPNGIESGSVYQFGNFDECITPNFDNFININNNPNNNEILSYDDNNQKSQRNPKITPKYCLADVTIDGLKVRSLASRKYQPTNSTTVHWGVCIPASCSSDDVKNLLASILNYSVDVEENKCYIQEEFQASKGMIVYGCIILCFVLMALFSTFYHLYMIVRNDSGKVKPHGCFEMIMKSFSAIENLQKLCQQSNDHLGLNAINGIKALSMLCIISGHALLFMTSGPVLNSGFFARDIKLVQNAFLLNSPLFVDTFLLLSGFLFCRILLRELERRHGKVNFIVLYIFRYIRLTPAYLAIIVFYATWLPKIGSGPLWNGRILLEQQRCQDSWWLNILYINNYIGNDNICMFQSWYLSADTQLFILAPIIIHLLWKFRRAGVWVLSFVTTVTMILPFLLTYFYDLDPTLLGFADEVEDISSNEFFTNVYIKTHMRATAYVFGLVTGFLLHYIQEKNITISKNIVFWLWIFSGVVGIASMFSITIFYVQPYNTLESSLYAGLHRFGWSFTTGWLVLASTTGNAGFLQSILSSRVFAPISRLTYCAYLTNGLVELYKLGTLRSPIYMSHINLLGETISHIGLTFISALVVCLLFESPIHGIEKIFLRIDQRQRQQLDERGDNRTPSTSEDMA